jgi:hypothetical protein
MLLNQALKAGALDRNHQGDKHILSILWTVLIGFIAGVIAKLVTAAAPTCRGEAPGHRHFVSPGWHLSQRAWRVRLAALVLRLAALVLRHRRADRLGLAAGIGSLESATHGAR